MTKCEIFLSYFDSLLKKANEKFDDLPREVRDFYAILQITKSGESDKPTFTPIGLQILEFMQQSCAKSFRAKDIAEGAMLPSRKASGAMRKLVNDGYVEKWGESPVNYVLTEQGKTIDLSQFKEENNND